MKETRWTEAAKVGGGGGGGRMKRVNKGGNTTGRLDRRTGWKDRQDWRPLITGGACARNAAALLFSIQ